MHNITATAIIAFTVVCGIFSKPIHATEKVLPHNQEIRDTITGLTIEGLSLNLTPDQAHESLISTGYQIHKGTEPGHGIYWKNETKALTKRIRLKSSIDKIYQIQLSFAEKGGIQAWQLFLNDIKSSLGTSIKLCEKASEQELNCVLVSEKPTQLSAEITTSQSKKANRIRVRLDHRTTKINIKSNLSFGSPRKK